MLPRSLPDLLSRSAERRPQHTAIEELPDHAISYAGLAQLSDVVRDRLAELGVRHGDRVGIYLPKSIDSVASLYGIMKAGAAYVPVDASAPAERCAYILHDCAVTVVIIDASLAPAWRAAAAKLGHAPAVIELAGTGGGVPLRAALGHPAAARSADLAGGDLAYILYTSGSTGRPKGVMLTHENALGFVRWCVDTFDVGEHDRFSSHAPLHFDLSIFDLYVPAWIGATVVLIGHEQGKEPMGLADLMAGRRLSVWYSTPSILSLIAQYGKMSRHRYPGMRLVFFAGEVFPVKHLRLVKQLLPARYYNLYGPTETNVCNWHPIPDEVPAERTEPYPIGKVCPHLRARVIDEALAEVPRGAEGELCIAGANVMQGYWNLGEQTAKAFLVDPDGTRWYRTGDIVTEGADGVFTYTGRRDRMVKRRGYRIELGEIEAAIYRNPDVREAAAITSRDGSGDVRITVFLALREGVTASAIAMKKFCAEALPMYMVPDTFVFRDSLPKTSTDKIDYQSLAAIR